MTRNVLEFMENSVAKVPDQIAVIEDDIAISYLQLREASQEIGSALAENHVFGTSVGVYMEKGIDALCTFFGIVYAGGCYAMLNTELPDARLRQIQSVLRAKVVVTTNELKEKAEELFPETTVYTVQSLRNHAIDEETLSLLRARAIDADPLYINFTSGSTGVPKGIAVGHRSVIDFIDCFTDIFSISKEDVIANQAPFDFDVSVKDIYSAMKTGATLLIVPRKFFSAPANLIDYLCENKATTLIWAVSALCLISTFHGLDYKTPASISKVMFSGEVMPYKHLCEWKKHLPNAMFVNLYGPTEITCNCTYHILKNGRDYSNGIPIGKPFPNEDVFLLGQNNEKIYQVGEIGSILVRGTALALGYYYLPEKNAASFTQNPLNDAYPELVYRTGDLGKYNTEGELVFCGRLDNQVKYMGHRVELEEIERAMSSIDGVERCCCIFDQKKSKLRGYYIGTIDKSELHSIMRETMPVFMVPGYIRKLEKFPMTKNGKIDRKKILETSGE